MCRRNGQRALIWNTDGRPGPAGKPGKTGAGGRPGKPGKPGKPGHAGATGAAGASGATGAQGPAGSTGADGAPGAKGNTGADGRPGPAGSTGAKGDTGSPGPTGPAGPSLSTNITGYITPLSNVGEVAVAASPPFTLTDSEPHLSLNAVVDISSNSQSQTPEQVICQFFVRDPNGSDQAVGPYFRQTVPAFTTDEGLAMSYWLSGVNAGNTEVGVWCTAEGGVDDVRPADVRRHHRDRLRTRPAPS